MFLLGGPAFSGKTLLAYMLNQGGIICLDEPDFHNPEQSHRGIPVLKKLFPDKQFPPAPQQRLSHAEAVRLIAECQEVIWPNRLGLKTANWTFIEYAKIYKKLGHPIIAMVRDIRDALVEAPLPPWLNEDGLNKAYRLIWKNLKLYDLCVRYENFVTKPEEVMGQISKTLSCKVFPKYSWNPESVSGIMVKLDRHSLLKEGAVITSRVGIWRTCSRSISKRTSKTARLMGYQDQNERLS